MMAVVAQAFTDGKRLEITHLGHLVHIPHPWGLPSLPLHGQWLCHTSHSLCSFCFPPAMAFTETNQNQRPHAVSVPRDPGPIWST